MKNIILFTLIAHSLSYTPSLEEMKDFICSYRGEPTVTETSPPTVECKCYSNYQTDPNESKRILNIPVKCSYAKKRRFIAFFLALFFPFGFEYIYLERYWSFAMFFLASTLIFGANVYILIVYKGNNYLKSRINLGCLVALVLHIGIIVCNVTLIAVGWIEDGQSFETVNDLQFLISSLTI